MRSARQRAEELRDEIHAALFAYDPNEPFTKDADAALSVLHREFLVALDRVDTLEAELDRAREADRILQKHLGDVEAGRDEASRTAQAMNKRANEAEAERDVLRGRVETLRSSALEVTDLLITSRVFLEDDELRAAAYRLRAAAGVEAETLDE